MPKLKQFLPGLVLSCFLGNSSLALETAAYRLQLPVEQAYRLQTTNTARPDKALVETDNGLKDKPFAREIAAAARESDLDPALVHAVIRVESAYRADAVSEKGAIGLMQLMPETARRFGVDNPLDPKANLRAGTRYLRLLLDLFEQRTDLALAAYNAGEGSVLRHARNIPPYPETQRYVPAVLGQFEAHRAQPPKTVDYLKGTRLKLEAPTK